MRRGFTLMELLIVITIIMVLMGLVFPAVTMIKNQANAVKCGNNLRQIALAMEVYRQNHDDVFPGALYDLLADGMDPKSFLCPFDHYHGTSSTMGRPTPWTDYTRLYDAHPPNVPAATHTPCSYCYEASGWCDPSICTSGDISYFWRDFVTATPPVTLPTTGSVSWGLGKQHQQKFGNLKTPGVAGIFGNSFTPDLVPVVRCYWHNTWPDYAPPGQDINLPRKVNNVMLGFNVAWSIPWWELTVDPALR
jgi:prepilin-type N-terminal cleavage/methylation domain-containing protein